MTPAKVTGNTKYASFRRQPVLGLYAANGGGSPVEGGFQL
jgi:hypothetical protein